MIKTLLQSGGEATTEEIATSLLAYDQSQVEYYSLRTNAMVGKVLTNNGVVEPIKDGRQITGYRLTETAHTEAHLRRSFQPPVNILKNCIAGHIVRLQHPMT